MIQIRVLNLYAAEGSIPDSAGLILCLFKAVWQFFQIQFRLFRADERRSYTEVDLAGFCEAHYSVSFVSARLRERLIALDNEPVAEVFCYPAVILDAVAYHCA